MVTAMKKKDARPSAKKQAIPGASRGATTFWLPPEDVALVTDQTHHLYDARVERPVDQDLKRRILRAGKVRVPISVVREDGHVLVQYGRGRVKALREINEERRAAGEEPWQIPCLVEKGEAKDLLEGMVDENDGRTGDNPIERAIKMANYVDLASEQEAAEFYDCSVATVKQTVKLLTLVRELQDAVAAGVVSVTQALHFVGRPREEQLALLQPDAPKKATKVVRPGLRKVGAVWAQVGIWAPDNQLALDLMEWAGGQISDKTLAKRYPHLAVDVVKDEKKTKKVKAAK